MSKTLALELPDEVYEAAERMAQRSGSDISSWIADRLPVLLPASVEGSVAAEPPPRQEVHPEILVLLQDVAHRMGQPVDQVIARFKSECWPTPPPKLTEEEKQAARERFRRHIGAVDLGYPTGADNESIDAELAQEYGNTHEVEA